MKDSTIVGLFGIGCLTALGIACIFRGLDMGVVLGLGATIGVAIGYAYGVLKKG